ncbi:Sugar kinase of the NBD/HSP70 family, may contain an N-terminal HTH domain [Microbispora rosea]|uniref:Sugar kinase of the NBD/HSP70 family, may contain an N-terminal HTH domain n=1 Tax=Microbispora rosea TaxID=58117 RepID=A0A1N7HJF1_9ACTN|nr:ROK family transcriptional regulator [Microbispora rosea]GIH50588.1 sugar kinase [Microbispora rosea subsp. rosea]SIS24871.1 Sugar kinase of the NBD/HSP70 family, may contain an N-terminal HTH domain [Microbispora rosea]
MATSPIGAGRPRTRGIVLNNIRAARTISRIELAAVSGVTPATITQVVRELMDHGLVVEVGRGVSTGGKPRTLLKLNPHAGYAVGVLLERNICVIVIVDLTGRQVARISFPGTALMPPERALPLVAARVNVLIDTAGVDRGRVLGVGLATYGPQDRQAGVLLTHQPTTAWFEYPVAPRLSEILSLPVLLDNDAAAAAIGEHWLGAVESRTYGCLYMASGIGGGVVVDGEVYRGSSSNGVEIGHITIDVNDGPCDCGNYGCLENYADPTAVVKQAMQEPSLGRRLGLDIADPDVMTMFGRIAAAADTGDPAAVALIERSARHLGTAAVTMASLFDLELIVLAGPSLAGAAASIYHAVIQEEVRQRTFARRAHRVRVVTSVSGSDAAAIGGAVLVLQSELAFLELDARA